MITLAERKEFALSELAPYLKDPNTCGYDKSTTNCEYLTQDGKMCVAGKNMLYPRFGENINIDELLNEAEQKDIFKPEAVGILDTIEWVAMQSIHDSIAHSRGIDMLKNRITRLNLFTYEELLERANRLK